MALTAIIFGLIAAFSFGISDFWGAKVAKRFGGSATAILIIFVAAFFYALTYLIFLREYTVFDGPAIAFSVASGIAFTIANLAFYKGLEYGPVNIVSPLGSLYPLVTLVLLVLVFGNPFSALQGVGIFVVVAGAAVASGLLDKTNTRRRISKGPLYGLIGAFFWGFAFCFIARAVDRIGWQFSTLVELTSSAMGFVLVLPLLNRAEPGLYRKLLKGFVSPIVIVAGLLIELAFWAITYGIDHSGTLAPVVVAVSACYPALTSFLALRHLNEEFHPVPLAGAFFGVLGIIILSLGG